ncbi:hypothetical protein POM88_005939 [Heracleum sosnowskyi]|uniref:Homeobox domain-containing protein n=1 Tax=Heracleum sosnowskyi TaxID=360622 RepID=A0AAD8N4W5_9APIA|nr:hypothetical protein POM88_005939 [Heracleum sosnowskyi]
MEIAQLLSAQTRLLMDWTLPLTSIEIDYLHQTGRTALLGAKGCASIVLYSQEFVLSPPTIFSLQGTECQVIGYPRKSIGLYVKQSIIFRYDSNGEDLKGYTGAGLYDWIISDRCGVSVAFSTAVVSPGKVSIMHSDSGNKFNGETWSSVQRNKSGPVASVEILDVDKQQKPSNASPKIGHSHKLEAGLSGVVSGPVVIDTIQDGGSAVTAAAAAVFGVAVGAVATGGASAAAVAMGGAATAIGDGDAGAGDDDDACNPSSRRWRMNRHTGHHINALEEYFKEHSYPNELQRNEFALRLGMHPTQVMCWFQNKRTQMRSQSKREENKVLKSENNMLRAQIQHFTEVLSKHICPQCGVSSSQQYVDENILRSENIHLREEV